MPLIDRVKRLLLTPEPEWRVIDAEATSVGDLYTGYIMPLAAIGPVATVIGYSVFGVRSPLGGAVYRIPIGSAITSAIVSYVLALAGVYVLGLIIDGLAPTFGGTRNQMQALKAAAYSSTAAWVAGIFAMAPGLRMLGILGLYSFYLLYVGLPVVMKAPAERAGAYTVVVVIAAIVLFAVTAMIGSRMLPMGAM